MRPAGFIGTFLVIMNPSKELDLLKQFMYVYIQLLPSIFSGRIKKPQLPTFEYFKETYNKEAYSLIIPKYKESKVVIENRISTNPTHGIGSNSGIGYRYYNYWMGIKYYPLDNNEDYTICDNELNNTLKRE